MLDYRWLEDGTGSTSLVSIAAQTPGIATGEDAVIAGVPTIDATKAGPILEAVIWDELVAGTPIKQIAVQGDDFLDSQNGLDFGGSTEFPPDFVVEELHHPWGIKALAPVVVKYSQTAAAKIIAGLLWRYPNPQAYGATKLPLRASQIDAMMQNSTAKPFYYSGQFSAALTAQTVSKQAASVGTFAASDYAILGAQSTGQTKYAHIRFLSNKFGSFKPGFPLLDSKVALTLAGAMNQLAAPLWVTRPGWQFYWLSKWLGDAPVIPVATGTLGNPQLQAEILDNTGDTLNVILAGMYLPTTTSP